MGHSFETLSFSLCLDSIVVGASQGCSVLAPVYHLAVVDGMDVAFADAMSMVFEVA